MLDMLAMLVLSKLAEKNAVDRSLEKKKKLDLERKAKLAELADQKRKRTMKASAESFDPAKRQVTVDTAQAASKQQLTGALAPDLAATVTPLSTPTYTGKLSADELAARAKETEVRTKAGSDFADILSRLSAQQTTDLTNALRMGESGALNRLDTSSGRRMSEDYDTRIDAIHPNSTQMILSNLGQTYAMGSMLGNISNGAGVASKTAPAVAPLGPRTYGYNIPQIPQPIRLPYTPIR